MNVQIISGNLVADPEPFVANSGTVGVNFRIANNELVHGEPKLNAFTDVTAWKGQAQNIGLSLKSGDRVLIAARLSQQTWKRPDGGNASKLYLEAIEVAASMLFGPVGVTRKAVVETVVEAPPTPPTPPAPPS